MKYRCILIIIFIYINFSLNSQIIPDNIFRGVINGYLDQPEEYQPTIEDLNSITRSIHVEGEHSIESIEGAQYLTNISGFWISNNNIADISPISNLSNLEELNLSGNLITDIPNLNLPNLSLLFLHGNQITDISLLDLPNLEQLTLSGNQITEIPHLDLPNLVYLYLNENQITELPVLDLPALEKLDLRRNQITDIQPFVSPNLLYLDLSYNQLSSITSLVYANLIYLDISNNQLAETITLNLPNLEELRLNSNQLTEIPFLDLPNLRDLGLHRNQITEINNLNLPNLLKLSLSYNQISEISSLDLPNLESLYIHNNQISELPILDLPNLEVLDLEYNQISELPSLDYPNLCVLDISHNQITKIFPLNLPNLYNLGLDNNQITELPNLDLPSLFWFNLDNNQITDIGNLLFYNSSNPSVRLDNNPLTFESVETIIPDLEMTIHHNNTSNFNVACYPNPTRYQENTPLSCPLEWKGNFNDDLYQYRIYLGTSQNDLIYIGDGTESEENTFYIDTELNPNTDYFWRVESCNETESFWTSIWYFTTGTYNHIDNQDYSSITKLYDNYPNPFSLSNTNRESRIKICFNINQGESAKIEIFNLKGQMLKTFDKLNDETHEVLWNGCDYYNQKVSSGIYFYRLKSESINETKKMILLK